MKKEKRELGTGYIEAACEAIGVSRGVYYNALKNRKEGLPMTKDQIDVLVKYKELLAEGEQKLEFLKK